MCESVSYSPRCMQIAQHLGPWSQLHAVKLTSCARHSSCAILGCLSAHAAFFAWHDRAMESDDMYSAYETEFASDAAGS